MIYTSSLEAIEEKKKTTKTFAIVDKKIFQGVNDFLKYLKLILNYYLLKTEKKREKYVFDFCWSVVFFSCEFVSSRLSQTKACMNHDCSHFRYTDRCRQKKAKV